MIDADGSIRVSMLPSVEDSLNDCKRINEAVKPTVVPLVIPFFH